MITKSTKYNSKSQCYLLKDELSVATYVGTTNNFYRRLRQHRKEIKGGAVYTKRGSFFPVCCIEGFNSQRSAKQFEYAWKHITSNPDYGDWKNQILTYFDSQPSIFEKFPLLGRMYTRLLHLFFLLSQSQWSAKSEPAQKFSLKIHFFHSCFTETRLFQYLCNQKFPVMLLVFQNRQKFSLQEIYDFFKPQRVKDSQERQKRKRKRNTFSQRRNDTENKNIKEKSS